MRTGSLPFVLAVIILNDEDLPQRNEVEKKASHDSLSSIVIRFFLLLYFSGGHQLECNT